MRLVWCIADNPINNSTSPTLFDLSHADLSASQFSTLSQGGFADGTVAINNPSEQMIQRAVDTWFGKRIYATDGGGNIAYEGLIAEVSATINHTQFNRSLDNFVNRVFCSYKYGGGTCPKGATCKGSAVSPNPLTDTSIIGDTTTTIGIKEEWIDITGVGVRSSAFAQAAADQFLRRSVRSRTDSFQLGAKSTERENSLTLVLWGFYATLRWRKQSHKFKKSTEIGQIVKTALTSNSKAPFLSSDQSQIKNTGRSIKYNVDGKAVWLQDYIQAVLIDGDSNAKELFFQVWEDRMPYLTSRPSLPRYYTRSDSPRIWDSDRKLIPAYMVRAGGIVVNESANESTDPISDDIQRSRASFLDKTTYDDLNEQLTMHTANDLFTTERLLARARQTARNFIV